MDLYRFHKEKLLIIGAGGHGRVVSDIAMKMKAWHKIAFLDDQKTGRIMGLEILGNADSTDAYREEFDLFVAIGNNQTREAWLARLFKDGAGIPVLIHPAAEIGYDVDIGRGTAVMAGAVINCGSRIGRGCIVNTGATVDHDNVLEDCVHISPGAHLAGNVSVGRGSWIGIGAAVINNVHIAKGCIIGAGAAVIGDITEPGIYAGVPARRIKN